ncbi:uncharacterized protein LOC117174165 isoform X2 [Belonocnema kinseyi]|uniref:uncharacterized protein LOC117174165 isoform X2 n=1 Tax=Belonocnema kinseyi TaxID=2817044 RepID=UPI00143D9DCB|nr:uncharacterized protein LOC117174165 isoform X2 [Belonocnema kinseyi]
MEAGHLLKILNTRAQPAIVSERAIDSLSEKTLHSFKLYCTDEQVLSTKNLQNSRSEILPSDHTCSENSSTFKNGQHDGEADQLTEKKPSYLGLACSISGYSGINRYNSKLRESFRSRDSSLGPLLITKKDSPVQFRSNENLNILPHHTVRYPKSHSISPLAMDRQNGFTDGVIKNKSKIETFLQTRSSMSVCQGFSRVDKGVSLHSAFPEISPIHSKSPTKYSLASVHVASHNQQHRAYCSTISSSSQKAAADELPNTTFSETSITNGSTTEVENHFLNSSSSSEKSFIQQRVERLYGPGALAQGFFFKRSPNNKMNMNNSSFNKSNSDDNTSMHISNTEESLKNLPVLRHLRPEFRAQLPVVSPRKPTDGSEQMIKQLQRLWILPSELEAKEEEKVVEIVNKEGLKDDSCKVSSSTTSIKDHQPAALKVVLPVLEHSGSTITEPEQVEEAVVDKNGHYFMKVLKEEKDRLISLAASAENELAGGDPSVLPDEAAGKLRAAAGKARLLASQKMQQFEGLCQKNVNQVEGEEFPTKNEDLEGFWDMLMLQVVQVHELFKQIESLKNSQWQEIITEKISIPGFIKNGNLHKRRSTNLPKVKSTPISEANKKAREAREQSRRQILEERRRAMRSIPKNADNPVKIFISET